MTKIGLRNFMVAAVLAAGMAVSSISAQAQVGLLLPPGGDTSPLPPPINPGPMGTLVDTCTHTGVVATNALGQVLYTFDVTQKVYAYNAAGNLAFHTQVSNLAGSIDAISRFTLTDYTGWTTWVSQNAGGYDGFLVGTVASTSVERQFTGGSIGFRFSDAISPGIAPGTTSFVAIVETNATSYAAGTINTLNGAVASVVCFAPVPEASSMAMILPGLLPLGFVLRRRMAKKA